MSARPELFSKGASPPDSKKGSSSRPLSNGDLSDAVMDVLRRAHDDVERKVTHELDKAFGAQSQLKTELEQARARNLELQKELDKCNTQKNYVTDAFEAGRKETAKLKTEAALASEEIARLRKAVEDMQADRVASKVTHKVMEQEFSALEVEKDVLGRALGAATKQLFGKQQQQQAAVVETPAGKPRVGQPALKKTGARPVAKPMGSSPRVNTPTGGAKRSGTPVQPPRSAWN